MTPHYVVHTQLSILFQWQSKVIELVASFSFHLFNSIQFKVLYYNIYRCWWRYYCPEYSCNTARITSSNKQSINQFQINFTLPEHLGSSQSLLGLVLLYFSVYHFVDHCLFFSSFILVIVFSVLRFTTSG